MKAVVIARYQAFGTEGQAQKMKPHSLDAMHDQYLSGALDPVVQ
jgi:fructose-bisphosphate aldolase class II